MDRSWEYGGNSLDLGLPFLCNIPSYVRNYPFTRKRIPLDKKQGDHNGHFET